VIWKTPVICKGQGESQDWVIWKKKLAIRVTWKRHFAVLGNLETTFRRVG